MLNCIYCYQVKFANWIEYHDHYVEHHGGSVQIHGESTGAEIRAKAWATLLNVSGRSKRQIVEDIERDQQHLFQCPENVSLSDWYKNMSPGRKQC